MASVHPPGAGSRLGRYELVKEQAGSGVASIWFARTETSDKLFSILRVHRHVIKKTEHIEAFLDEATRAKPLKHENVVPFVDLGVNDGEVFVVLEYVEGELLSSLVTLSGPAGLPQPIALRIARDVLSAIAAAHALATPLIHGELGAHQVRVGVDGKARVGGFGIAHAVSRMGAHGVKNHDRLAYAAPERVKVMAAPLSGTPAPSDPKGDVFSAGVIVWELVAKQRLFASRIEAAVIQKVLTAPIATLSSTSGVEVSAELDAAVQHALTRETATRAATVNELIEAIDASTVATHEEVAELVEKLAGKAIQTRRQELKDVATNGASTSPPAPSVSPAPSSVGAAPVSSAAPSPPKPSNRKATLMGFVAPGIEVPPSSQSKPPVPQKPAEPEPRKQLVSLDDEWLQADDSKPDIAPLAAKPPPPPRKAAPTVLGMAPLGAIEPTAPLEASPLSARAPEPPPKRSESPPQPPKKPSAPPPAKRAGTLMLGSLGAPAMLASTVPAETVKPPKTPEAAAKPATPKPAEAASNGALSVLDERPTDTPSSGGASKKRGPAASALDKVHPGTTLGRYEILTPLARGGMASVWAGRMQGTRGFSKIVAIKTMLPDISDDVDFQKMFLDEARVAARIKHPNVAEILDLGEEDDVLYIVMDWIEGDTLGALQKAAKPLGGIPLNIAVRIASQTLGGLHAAHELRDDSGNLLDLVHRDVSPGNVLVSIQGFVKMVDFGIAKSKGRLHVTRAGGLVKGKTPYLSPEQLGQLPIDRRSDIFSFGCLLYVLTTRLHPFRGENEVKTVENIALKAPVPPRELNPAIPPELDALILRTLEKDPAKRYATAAELQRALGQVAALLDPTSDEDVAEFVKSALGDAHAKRAQDIKAAIAAIEETTAGKTPPPRVIAVSAAAAEAAKEISEPAAKRPREAPANEVKSTPVEATAPVESAEKAADAAVAASATTEPTDVLDVLNGGASAEAPIVEPEADPAPRLSSPAARASADFDDAALAPKRRANLKYIVFGALGLCILVIGGAAIATSGGSAKPSATTSAAAAPAAPAAPSDTPTPSTESVANDTKTAAPPEAAPPPAPSATASATAEATAPEPSATADASAKAAAHAPQHSPVSAGRPGQVWHPAKPAAAPRPKKYNPSGI